MKKTVLAILILAIAALAKPPSGQWDLAFNPSVIDANDNSMYLLTGKKERDGMCHYLGIVQLRPAMNGECHEILLLHLFTMEGDANGLMCGYDEDQFGEEAVSNGTVRKHCPDLLAVDHHNLKVYGEFDYDRSINQADYWDPNGRKPGFRYNIKKSYLDSNPVLQEQVRYRFSYNWETLVQQDPDIIQAMYEKYGPAKIQPTH